MRPAPSYHISWPNCEEKTRGRAGGMVRCAASGLAARGRVVLHWRTGGAAIYRLGDNRMKTRPISITIIGWYLLVAGTLGLFNTLWSTVRLLRGNSALEAALREASVPISVQLTVSFVASLVALVCGYFTLQGRGWARSLYLVVTLGIIVFHAATSPFGMMTLPGLVILAVVAYFLFRPAAGEFFRSGGEGYARPTRRRTVSIVFYILSGLFLQMTCALAFMDMSGSALKWLMLCFPLALGAGLMSIARIVSRQRDWARDVGVVLIASAAFGAAMAIAAGTFAPSESKPANRPASRLLEYDYIGGVAWTASMAALGVAGVVAGLRAARPGWTGPGARRGDSGDSPAANLGI